MNETIFERHFAALSISSWIILAYRHSSLETYPAPAWGWMRPDGTAGFVVCLLAPEMNGSHLLAAPKNGMVSSPKVGLKPTKVIKQRKLLRVHNIYNIIYVCICIYIYTYIYIYIHEWRTKLFVPRNCHGRNWIVPYRLWRFSLFDNIQ